ncbi:MAG: excinuclease ABC subunit B [Spirochaetaceae bacterium]|nr:excinuclease ABC subunit B [Spirochaetaceae bacterium]
MRKFQLVSEYAPSGDQITAIDALAQGILRGDRYQTLKGVTGSGKTFTMANIIERVQRPTLIISHNKTLSAQLYSEFKNFFPHNAVEYFVSYYDYYQPEAYVPARDLYIEKDASINDEIDRMRLRATFSLMERRDVIVVATVSCIYGLGLPETWKDLRIHIDKNIDMEPAVLKRQLTALQYERNDDVLERGRYRSKGDVIEIFPAYLEEAYRVEFDWETITSIKKFNPLTHEIVADYDELTIYPAKHFVMPEDAIPNAIGRIRKQLDDRLQELRQAGSILEAERLKTRTEYDLEMLAEMGYCPGIENYSAPIANRKPGEPPATLFHYFPDDFIVFLDESHVTLPQVGGMYEGDRSRKQNLVNFGFRLPSALDNRPLKIAEFEAKIKQAIFVSATPGKTEVAKSTQVVEQLIRPTGLLDPILEVHTSEGQMEDIYREVTERIARGERSLLLTLTKKMAEDLTEYLLSLNLKVKYIHSEVETIERVEILKGLRNGEFDVLVGINLLREGIDLPEVSFIGILDADKIGFLRSTTSLIQIIGRAARNAEGKVILYADRISDAMKEAITETNRRRSIQERYNKEHHITPKTITKAITDILVRENETKAEAVTDELEPILNSHNIFNGNERKKLIAKLEKQMAEYADMLMYEQAAILRDKIIELKSFKK